MTATAKEAIERYYATGECEECGHDELIVEKGGGVVSITCPNCWFSASAEEGEVDEEWQQFLTTLRALEPHERKPFLLGAALGAFKAVVLFIGALLLNAVDGGGKGLGR